MCSDPSRGDFWRDLNRAIPTNASGFINLRLNPERWTGYDGAHVWTAIYRENRFGGNGLEEAVLFRLVSGMHASINIHISEAYHPPAKGKRSEWAPNVERFVRQFGEHPERLRNLHFAYVVLLRALRRGAAYLSSYSYAGGDDVSEERRTALLMRRLLESRELEASKAVFAAFDETRLFNAAGSPGTNMTDVKAKFKTAFQNISAVLDCVSCQKCRLHGKIQLLGVGAALKLLLLPQELISTSLTRAEIVALVNTLHKFSRAVRAAPRLASLYASPTPDVRGQAGGSGAGAESGAGSSGTAQAAGRALGGSGWEAVDAGVAVVAAAAAGGRVGEGEERALVDALMQRDDDILVLATHYARTAPDRFLLHARRTLSNPLRAVSHLRRSAGSPPPMDAQAPQAADAVIIGGGLAGLSAALTILDAGGRVVLLEKMGHLGGNSAWASSGVNAVDVNDTKTGDSVDIFTSDVVRAAGRGDNPLVRVLTEGSVGSLAWLRKRLAENLNLDLVGQMGGHSKPRTHRPSSGLAGSAIIFALQKQVDKYLHAAPGGGTPALELRKWTRATKLVTQGERVVGVEYKEVTSKDPETPVKTGVVLGRHVVIATGGFAADYESDSLLRKHRPDLLQYATTNNKGTTGDGHKLALAVGAKAVDLNDVQVLSTRANA